MKWMKREVGCGNGDIEINHGKRKNLVQIKNPGIRERK